MKRLMHILFLSCLKATELIEKKFDFKLSFKEKIQLKIHKMMCSACSNYEKQSHSIENALENDSKHTHPNNADTCQLKEEILANLSKK